MTSVYSAIIFGIDDEDAGDAILIIMPRYERLFGQDRIRVS